MRLWPLLPCLCPFPERLRVVTWGYPLHLPGVTEALGDSWGRERGSGNLEL